MTEPRVALPAVIAGARPACGADVTTMGGETMGTRWSVRIVLPVDLTARAVHGAIVDRLAGLVAEMSHWAPTSLLCGFNRSRAGEWTPLPPDFAHVMAQGLAIAAATGGAFDPAIGRIVDLWGLGPVAAAARPTPEAIDRALALSCWRRLALEDAALCQPGGLALDLSGIAKGHAVDAVADLLGAMGVAHALVEIGGELVGRGVRPDGQPWWVDLETPPGLDLAPFRIALHGLAVATSGDAWRGAHTIDPRTGYPTTNGVVSASVVHDSALAADAWATALTVLGPAEGIALATDARIAARIVTGGGPEYLSPELAAMLDA